MLRFVLVGPKGVGKSSIFSRLSPQATGSSRFGSNQTIPVPPSLFSVVTLDFPSLTFSSLTQKESLPQVISSSNAIIFVITDSKDENLFEFFNLLTKFDFHQNRYILFHQIDKIDKDLHKIKFEEIIKNSQNVGVNQNNCFLTSLFDGSLPKTFTKIVSTLLPNFEKLNSLIYQFSEACQASRVIICDSATFLPICDTSENKSEQPQPIFDFFLRIFPKKKLMKTITFESNTSILVFTTLTNNTYIFITSSSTHITTDSILFNIKRILPKLQKYVVID